VLAGAPNGTPATSSIVIKDRFTMVLGFSGLVIVDGRPVDSKTANRQFAP
jgi:hypothetical protein